MKTEIGIKANINFLNLDGDFKPTKKQLKALSQYADNGDKDLLTKNGIPLSVIKKKGGKHNIIVNVGRGVLAQRLAGDTTYTGEITYGALGTAVAPVPANTDTQLGNEVFRKIPASSSVDGNIVYIDFFYSAADCDGTYTEFGNFIDGEAGADTGQLFSYIATGGWVKSSSESLFVSCRYTIS